MNNPDITRFRAGLARRYAAEKRFKFYGIFSVALALTFLAVLFISIVGNGHTAFQQTKMRLEVDLSASEFTQAVSENDFSKVSFKSAINRALYSLFPEVTSRSDKKTLRRLISATAP